MGNEVSTSKGKDKTETRIAGSPGKENLTPSGNSEVYQTPIKKSLIPVPVSPLFMPEFDKKANMVQTESPTSATSSAAKIRRSRSLFRRRRAKTVDPHQPQPMRTSSEEEKKEEIFMTTSGSQEESLEVTEEDWNNSPSRKEESTPIVEPPQLKTLQPPPPPPNPEDLFHTPEAQTGKHPISAPSLLSPVIERTDSETASTSSQVVSGLLAVSGDSGKDVLSSKQDTAAPPDLACPALEDKQEEPTNAKHPVVEANQISPAKDQAGKEKATGPSEMGVPLSVAPQVNSAESSPKQVLHVEVKEPEKTAELVSPPRTSPPALNTHASSPSPLSLSSPQQAQMASMQQQDSMPAPPEFNEPHQPVSSPTHEMTKRQQPQHMPVPTMVTTPAKPHPKTLSPVSTPKNTSKKVVSGNTPVAGGSPTTATTATSATTMVASSGPVAMGSSQQPARQKSTADLIRTDLWSPDKSLVLDAMKHVIADAAASEKNRSLIARTGGLFAVVKAMESHSAVTEIQIAGCQALEKLALDTDNEIAIEQVGGVETILAAMMGHFDNAKVHEAAWAALWNLTCSNASKDLTLDTAGGMQAIVAAMKSHMDSPAVQKNACGALSNLCQNNAKRMEAFAEANGFVVVATAMQKYWTSDPEVRAEACHTMTALCEGFAGRPASSSKSTALTVSSPSIVSAPSPSAAARTTPLHGGTYLPGGYLSHRMGMPVHHHQNAIASDLQSLASMSYFEEETVYD